MALRQRKKRNNLPVTRSARQKAREIEICTPCRMCLFLSDSYNELTNTHYSVQIVTLSSPLLYATSRKINVLFTIRVRVSF